ncbi:MAG: tRNA (adenosine(37)-N6)-threonylcarbamoyltransferase complex ATPase subunit type 1 TsaE [Snowella sp.]|nr:tRNA (adenosine(37)-N6)-threonylcarbamoyltransferase complex ATPase subunit type 1 TsaE [Snowella sp.]
MLQNVLIVPLASGEETQQLGRQLSEQLPAGTIVLLQGDLGAGKTTLVQGIGEGLGITDPIVSPTFTLVNEYAEGRIPLYHFDLYRLEPIEVTSLYLNHYWEGEEFPLGLVAIEWPERLPVKPKSYLQIDLTHTENHGRQAVLQWFGTPAIALEALNLPK